MVEYPHQQLEGGRDEVDDFDGSSSGTGKKPRIRNMASLDRRYALKIRTNHVGRGCAFPIEQVEANSFGPGIRALITNHMLPYTQSSRRGSLLRVHWRLEATLNK